MNTAVKLGSSPIVTTLSGLHLTAVIFSKKWPMARPLKHDIFEAHVDSGVNPVDAEAHNGFHLGE